MHEKQVRRIGQHVTVKRRYCNAVVSWGNKNSIHFAGDPHEVAGDCRLASTCRLKVDRLRRALLDISSALDSSRDDPPFKDLTRRIGVAK